MSGKILQKLQILQIPGKTGLPAAAPAAPAAREQKLANARRAAPPPVPKLGHLALLLAIM
jgi:hypothetical protein